MDSLARRRLSIHNEQETFFTFDKEKEDNPWPFVMGIIFSLIGLLYVYYRSDSPSNNLIPYYL
jgi:hypothetical protein